MLLESCLLLALTYLLLIIFRAERIAVYDEQERQIIRLPKEFLLYMLMGFNLLFATLTMTCALKCVKFYNII